MSDKGNIKQENHKQMNNLLLDVLRAWELKLMHNDCTAEEIRKCYDLVSDNLDVLVTTKDIADIYKKPLPSVKETIYRNKLSDENPPKVRKFYSLMKFRKIMPNSWANSSK